jgi:hypothetical protein
MALGGSLDYYDRIVAAIAVSLGGGVVAGTLADLRLHVGLLAGALVASTFVYHAMFRNPPRPTSSRGVRAAAVAWHVFVAVLVVLTVR